MSFTDKDNPTLLHVACRYGMLGLVKVIVNKLRRGKTDRESIEEMSSLVHILDKDQRNCLAIADHGEHSPLSEYLRGYLVSSVIAMVMDAS